MPATEDQVKGLVKLAERNRPLVLQVKTEAVVEQLVGKVEPLTAAFVTKCNELLKLLDERTKYLAAQLATSVGGVQAATAHMKAGAALIQTKITVDFKQGWRWSAGLLLGPVAFLLLGMGVTGQFSKVSKSDFEQLQAQQQQLQAQNATLTKTNQQLGATTVRYEAQIKRYRGKGLVARQANTQANVNNRQAVQLATLLKTNGVTLRAIAVQLNQSGYCTRRGKAFHPMGVQRLLTKLP